MKISCDIREMDKIAYELQKKLFAQITEDIVPSVTSTHLYMLIFIREHGECMVTDIANYLGVTLGAVTSIVDKLCDFGLVIRERSETDRRLVIIKLSEEGKELLEKIDMKRRQIFDFCFKDIDQTEITIFNSIMERIIEKLLNA